MSRTELSDKLRHIYQMGVSHGAALVGDVAEGGVLLGDTFEGGVLVGGRGKKKNKKKKAAEAAAKAAIAVVENNEKVKNLLMNKFNVNDDFKPLLAYAKPKCKGKGKISALD